jgi:hypothetical protein
MRRNHGAVLVAVLAALSITASAAQAHEYRVEGKPIAAGVEMPFKTAQWQAGVVLHTKPLGVNMTVSCEGSEAKGSLLAGGKTNTQFSLGGKYGCIVSQVANCTIPSPVVMDTVSQLVSFEGWVGEEFGPEAGKPLAAFTLGGAGCSIKGTYTLTGDQVCIISNRLVEQLMHEISCETSGSTLTFGGRSATMSTESFPIELGSKEKYSAS